MSNASVQVGQVNLYCNPTGQLILVQCQFIQPTVAMHLQAALQPTSILAAPFHAAPDLMSYVVLLHADCQTNLQQV